MGRPYGKFPERDSAVKRRKDSRGAPVSTRIRFKGRYDLEQATSLFLQLIARMQDAQITSIENCAIYLTPLGPSGHRRTLGVTSSDGQETMELFLPVAAKFASAARR